MGKPFGSAFLGWFATADLDDILHAEPRADSDAVDLHFSVGNGALQGWAYPHDLSIGAILNGECHDLVYTDELAAEQSDEGWRCSLCLHEPPRRYPTLEALWTGHLFEPFRRWCSEKLRTTSGINFYGDGGITSATLGEPEDDALHFQAIQWPRGAA